MIIIWTREFWCGKVNY